MECHQNHAELAEATAGICCPLPPLADFPCALSTGPLPPPAAGSKTCNGHGYQVGYTTRRPPQPLRTQVWLEQLEDLKTLLNLPAVLLVAGDGFLPPELSPSSLPRCPLRCSVHTLYDTRTSRFLHLLLATLFTPTTVACRYPPD